MGDLSRHFSRKEFACHCGCGFAIVDYYLLRGLEKLRAVIGDSPIVVLSGCRCIEHNRKIGGAPRSLHLSGEAADIWWRGSSLRAMCEAAALVPEFANGGIGVYPSGAGSFVHVDTRAGGPARWARIKGRYRPIEEAWSDEEGRDGSATIGGDRDSDNRPAAID